MTKKEIKAQSSIRTLDEEYNKAYGCYVERINAQPIEIRSLARMDDIVCTIREASHQGDEEARSGLVSRNNRRAMTHQDCKYCHVGFCTLRGRPLLCILTYYHKCEYFKHRQAMTSKQYRAIRKDLVALRDLIGKAYNKSIEMDSFEFDGNVKLGYEVHNVTGKLWQSYCAIDNEIIKLDKDINQ